MTEAIHNPSQGKYHNMKLVKTTKELHYDKVQNSAGEPSSRNRASAITRDPDKIGQWNIAIVHKQQHSPKAKMGWRGHWTKNMKASGTSADLHDQIHKPDEIRFPITESKAKAGAH